MGDSNDQNEWQAQVLRLTLFTLSKLPGSDTIWHDLTGRDPDIQENRVRENIQRQVGPHGTRELNVVVNPTRIDMSATPIVQSFPPPTHFGPATTEAAEFLALIKPWLAGVAQQKLINRIAFGAIFVLPASDRIQAYQELGKLLHAVQVDGEHSKELLYRINRPFVGQHRIEYNRITGWSSAVIRAGIVAGPGVGSAIEDQHFVRLEIDNNTPADRSEPLDRDAVVPIFEELVSLGSESALRGDPPG
jgi:hypothetical protein